MSRYRQTMTEAYAQVQLKENDYLQSRMNDKQIANIKQVWKTKTAKDVTPNVIKMIKGMDVPTQLAIKHANINQLSKLVETLDESFSDAQIAVLKKQYEPMRNKKISIDNANKLGQLFTKFDKDKNALEKLYGGDIPFVSVMAMTRLMTKHGYKADQLNKIRKEDIDYNELEILDEATQTLLDITEGKIDSKKFDSLKKGDTMTITYNSTMSGTTVQKFVVKSKSRSAKYNTDKVTMYPDGKPQMARYFLYKRASGDVSMATGDMAATVVNVKEEVTEGRMSQIDQMQKDGKSAAEIAKLMKLDVKTVKSILGEEVCPKCGEKDCGCEEYKEETLHEFKKMTVTFKSMDDMSKASTDLAKQGFTINAKGMVMKVDGKGADLNKYATDLKNFYKATVRAESYTIDESADEDFYNPVNEACWVGYTQKGMKKKGDKMVPNCVPESVQEAKEDENEEKKKKDISPESDAVDEKDKLKAELQKKDAEINALKTKAETEKAKVAKKETEKMVNPETGEPLLQVGIAYKHLRDKMKKEDTILEFTSQQIKQAYGIANDPRYKQGNYTGAVKAIEKLAKGLSKHPDVQKVLQRTNENLDEMAKDKAYAIGMATAKKKFNDEPPLDKKTIKKGHEIGDKLSKMKNEDHPAKQMFEQIEGLKNKAEKSGMPYGILKKVYDRGMAAWRGGHRPGASQQQWAFARVNSFITKSSGTWGGADKDLAAKVKGN